MNNKFVRFVLGTFFFLGTFSGMVLINAITKFVRESATYKPEYNTLLVVLMSGMVACVVATTLIGVRVCLGSKKKKSVDTEE